MSADTFDILAVIEGASEPISTATIAEQLGCAVRDVTQGLGELIASDRIVHVRASDNVLRYALQQSLDLETAHAMPSNAQAAIASEPAGANAKRGRISDVVLSVIRAATKPMSNPDIRAALDGKFTSQQVSSAVFYLNRNGDIRSLGKGFASRWLLVEKAEALPPPTTKAKKPKIVDELDKFVDAAESHEKTRKALEFAVRTAEDACDIYVAGIDNPAIYSPLTNARDQARLALNAWLETVKENAA